MNWIERLKEAAENATPAPWEYSNEPWGAEYLKSANKTVVTDDIWPRRSDLDFIAFARNNWESIVAVIEAADSTGDTKEIRKALAVLRDKVEGAEAPS